MLPVLPLAYAHLALAVTKLPAFSGAAKPSNLVKVSLAEAIYVLHAFQKKGQKTPRAEIELARKCYRAMLNERKLRWAKG